MLFWICFILYLAYHVVVFWYCKHVFLKTDRNLKLAYLAVVVNSLLLAAFLKIVPHDWILMTAYCGVLILEVKMIFKESWIKTIFGSACFSLNFFAIRLLYIVLYALNAQATITQIMDNRIAILHVAIFTLATSIPYAIVFKVFFPKNHLDSILSDKGNLKFVSAIVGLIYLYLILNSRNLYITESFDLMPLFQTKVAVCALLGFAAAFFYAFLFARLQLYAINCKKVQMEVKNEEKVMRVLENEAYHDGFTGCYTRVFAEKRIDRLLKEKTPFSLVFMDMDGLKTINDTYGHNEGDFYIRTTSDMIRQEFRQHVAARLGGDEFLVILEGEDSNYAMKYAVRCYDRIKDLSKIYDKSYYTSISYGILEVTTNNTLSREELLELVDSRMYEFKKSKKRNRVVKNTI